MKADRHCARWNARAGGVCILFCLLAALVGIAGCGKPASKTSVLGGASAGPVLQGESPTATQEIPESLPPDPKTLARIAETFAKTPARPLPREADISHSFSRWQTRADYWRRIFLGGFRAQKANDQARKPEAEKFLEGYCLRISQSPDAPSTKELSDQGEQLFDAGVHDPYVTLALTAVLFDSKLDKSPRFSEVRRSLDEAFRNGPGSPLIAARFHHLKAVMSAEEAGEAGGTRRKEMELMIDDLLRAAADPEITNMDRRVLVQLLSGWETDFRSGPFRVALTMKLENTTNTDPWVREMVLAHLYHSVVWKIRANGFGDSLSENHGNMEHARRHALRAWELKPELPEAANEMLKITMADKGAADENVRFWFDEAIQADFIYLEAYYNLAWALRPRWKGDHNQMLAFGDECLATGRFDTPIPLLFHKMVSDVVEEQGDWGALLRMPGIYERYCTLYEAMAKNAKDDAARDRQRTQLAAVSYLAGKKDECRRILTKLADAAKPSDFEMFNLSLDEVRQELGFN